MIILALMLGVLLPGLLAALSICMAKAPWRLPGAVAAFILPAVVFGGLIYLTERDLRLAPGMNYDGAGVVIVLLWFGLVTGLVSAAVGTGVGLLVRYIGRPKIKAPDVF